MEPGHRTPGHQEDGGDWEGLPIEETSLATRPDAGTVKLTADLTIKEEIPDDRDRRGGGPNAVTDEQLIAMLVERTRGEGLQRTGEGELLQQLTKRVLESARRARSPITSATTSTTRRQQPQRIAHQDGAHRRRPRRGHGCHTTPSARSSRRWSASDSAGCRGDGVVLSAKGLTLEEICAHLAEVCSGATS
nr:hypothetical protein GCM10010200_100750 [Actinomadura rugatobispora]